MPTIGVAKAIPTILVVLWQTRAAQAYTFQAGNNGLVQWAYGCDFPDVDGDPVVLSVSDPGWDCGLQCVDDAACTHFAWQNRTEAAGRCFIRAAPSAYFVDNTGSGAFCGYAVASFTVVDPPASASASASAASLPAASTSPASGPGSASSPSSSSSLPEPASASSQISPSNGSLNIPFFTAPATLDQSNSSSPPNNSAIFASVGAAIAVLAGAGGAVAYYRRRNGNTSVSSARRSQIRSVASIESIVPVDLNIFKGTAALRKPPPLPANNLNGEPSVDNDDIEGVLDNYQ
ncbi:hypothetical protein HK100_009030 [Physocladia obscura]|uniref:Apple domain-containing protein n=1 Tax=Physocladia obscura TaxID=109957 RepID=A0AAD5SP03_9FUNG|nr:hypothetical protein HK100_009030 [Physocladia obscura]